MHKSNNSLSMHNVVQQLTRDEIVTVTVRGECMMPWIESDARLQITPARYYWPGDVVVALSRNSHYLVHRVIGGYWRTGRLKLLTQADSALRSDIAVLPDDILGRITGGSCHPCVVSVPLSHRLKALLFFGKFFFRKVVKR